MIESARKYNRAYEIGDRAAATIEAGRLFFRWWAGEISSLLPRKVIENLFPARDRIVIQDNDGHFTATGFRGDEEVTLVKNANWSDEETKFPADLQDVEATLLLAREHTIRTEFNLPKLSRREREQAIALRLGAELPIMPEAGYFAHEILEETDDSVRISLIGALKSDIDDLVKRLERAGIEGVRVVTNGSNGDEAVLVDGKRGQGSGVKGWRRVIGAMPAVLLVAALAVYSLRLNAAEERIGEELAATAPELKVLALLEEEFEKNRGVTAFLANEMARPAAAALISEITEVLPDTAWVNEFHLVDNSVRISGFAAAPEALVALLESSPLFDDVRLGAVSALAGGKNVKYQITFSLEEAAPEGRGP